MFTKTPPLKLQAFTAILRGPTYKKDVFMNEDRDWPSEKENTEVVTKQQAPVFFTAEGTHEGVIEVCRIVVLPSETLCSKGRLKNITELRSCPKTVNIHVFKGMLIHLSVYFIPPL